MRPAYVLSGLRSPEGKYGFVLDFFDGSAPYSEPCKWDTLHAMHQRAAELLAGEFSKRDALAVVP